MMEPTYIISTGFHGKFQWAFNHVKGKKKDIMIRYIYTSSYRYIIICINSQVT